MKKISIFKILAATFFLVSILPVMATPKDEPKKSEKSPVYVLSASNYSSITKDGLVLVDFWAAWCGPCRRLSPILEEIAVEHKDSVKVTKLNVDNYKQFAIDMGVSALPTIIVYKDGKEVTRIEGLVSKEKIEGIIRKYAEKKD